MQRVILDSDDEEESEQDTTNRKSNPGDFMMGGYTTIYLFAYLAGRSLFLEEMGGAFVAVTSRSLSNGDGGILPDDEGEWNPSSLWKTLTCVW
jgi:hypothetical protein